MMPVCCGEKPGSWRFNLCQPLGHSALFANISQASPFRLFLAVGDFVVYFPCDQTEDLRRRKPFIHDSAAVCPQSAAFEDLERSVLDNHALRRRLPRLIGSAALAQQPSERSAAAHGVVAHPAIMLREVNA